MLHALANVQSFCGTKRAGKAVLGDLVLPAPQRLYRVDRHPGAILSAFLLVIFLLVGQGVDSPGWKRFP
jgi:hypothetical protein